MDEADRDATACDVGAHREEAQSMRAAVLGDVAARLADLVIEACAERRIVPMPLKGVLLLRRWPELRGQRDLLDVDFLVRPSDLHTFAMVLEELGFEANTRSTAGRTFSSDAWPLSIDLHRELFPHGLFSMATEPVFARAEVDASLFSAPVARMSNEDLFAHLIGHLVKGREVLAHATSLRDFRWLSRRGLWRDPAALGRHLRALGLRRAAGYVLEHPALHTDPLAPAVLRGLELSRMDRAVIAVARAAAAAKRDEPPRWVPHLLDSSLRAGSRSLWAHLDEARRRLSGQLTAH